MSYDKVLKVTAPINYKTTMRLQVAIYKEMHATVLRFLMGKYIKSIKHISQILMILPCKFIQTFFYSFKEKKSHSPTCVQKINHQQSSTKIISNTIGFRMKPFIPEPKNGQDIQTDHSKTNHSSHQKYNAQNFYKNFRRPQPQNMSTN